MKDSTFWKALLAPVDDDNAFRFSNGKSAKSIHELITILDNAPNKLFTEHVNDHKNDIAAWIEHMFNDHELAHELHVIGDQKGTVAFLRKRLKEASAYVDHYQQPAGRHNEHVAHISKKIEHLEKDLGAHLDHTTHSAPFRYAATKDMSVHSKQIFWREIIAATLIGFIFGILIGRLSGII